MEEAKAKHTESIQIDEKDVPVLVQEQFTALNEYASSVELAKRKANEVNRATVKSQEKGVHVLKMKSSIEDIQVNQVALAESNMINAELQEKSLKYQKKLSEIMQYLLGLGVTNIAVNRCVVKELLMRLENASEEEIDEMTRQEILKVIQQLKDQEDLYKKTMDITDLVQKHDELIRILLAENKETHGRLLEMNNKNKKEFRYFLILVLSGLLLAVLAFTFSLLK
ncbi:MAG: hypothetical protein EOM74_00450 [Methanomicrobia archaeon]|nr:hypothetical protein [Methanomicrobia archaeon]